MILLKNLEPLAQHSALYEYSHEACEHVEQKSSSSVWYTRRVSPKVV